ncbi:hypothetical protein Tco_0505142 [Tanacetum coccineum]
MQSFIENSFQAIDDDELKQCSGETDVWVGSLTGSVDSDETLMSDLCGDGIYERYFDVDLTVRKLVMNRLGQLLRNFRRKLRQTYILPNQDTPSKLNEVPTKYTAILKAKDWVNFVNYTATEEYKFYTSNITTSKRLMILCYKVSLDKSLVDAAFIPDVGSNGCTTVLDAVGGFVAWPHNQVVLDPKATPPSTIQMITGENKTAPKVQTKG